MSHLAADNVLDLKNSETVRGFADTPSVAPRPLHLCRDGKEFVIFPRWRCLVEDDP
jgi:hypothetical protein